MTASNERLDRIEATLEKVVDELAQLRREQGQMREDQDRGREWENRTWDVIKWVSGISAALSISAAVALVGLVIRLALSGQ